MTPQRPTLSSDTGTTAPGSFELETGVVVDPGDSFSLPSSLKFGAGERTELFLGFSPYERLERPGADGEGFGDTFIGTRYRFWEGTEETSAAVQMVTKLPTGDEREGLSSGELDLGLAGIVTQELDDRTVGTAYYELGFLGDPQASGTDTQHAFAVAASRSLEGHLGVFAELAFVQGADHVDPFVATVGVTRALGPGLSFDLGLGIGLNHDAPDTALLGGVTMSLGRVFP